MKYIYVIGCVNQRNSNASFSFPTLGAYTSESAAQERMDELKQYRLKDGATVYYDTPIEWVWNGEEIRRIYLGYSGPGWEEKEHLFLVKYRM